MITTEQLFSTLIGWSFGIIIAQVMISIVENESISKGIKRVFLVLINLWGFAGWLYYRIHNHI